MSIKILLHIYHGTYFSKLGNGVIWILDIYIMYDIKILVKTETV